MGTRSKNKELKPAGRSARSNPSPFPDAKTGPIPNLHRAIGNQGVLELIQAKLKISQPQDPLEQEADRMADEITDAGIAPAAQEIGSPNGLSAQQPAGAELPGMEFGTGEELDETTRTEAEARLGTDLSSVRAHTGPEANSAAEMLDARAFTIGRSIVFGPGEYSPDTGEGRRLIAHELAHVAQQGEGETQVQRQSTQKPKPAQPQTPHDRMVVERAKKRLALLNKYVDQYAAREGRRLRSKPERDALLEKREKMDIEGFNPFAEIEQRGKMESQRIAALNTRPLKIELSENEVRFKVKFHVRFEDPKQESKFGELKSSLLRGIELVWNQTLRGQVFGGRKFTVEPEIVKVAATAGRDMNYWLITVRAADTGAVNYPGCTLDQPPPDTPTSVTDPTCDGGVMSIPPSHISKPDILGHELLHLFGFVDRYMMQTIMAPGKKPRVVIESTRKTGGRPDPLGSETGPVLAEDLAFLFDRLGIYEMEENRGLDALRELEGQGLGLGLVLGEIHRQEEIIEAGRDPHSLIPIRKDFTDKMIKQAEDL
jgi:uncharacterized protein DUF4157